MPTIEHLKVVYQVLDSQAQSAYRRLRDTTRSAHAEIERGSARASSAMSGIAVKAAAAAAAIVALGAAMAKATQYTDAYKQIENQLGSIGQTADDAAEALLAVALRSRAAVGDLATNVARLEKATGDGFETSLRRAETLTKLLAISGATAGEVSSVMTQLTQALASGTLQGDEFRSLRETAPIEFMEALAAAAGTTRGQLKTFAEEGKLTSVVITEALDNMAATADQKFGQTAQTIGQGLTNITSALTVFVGRLDEGLGASDRLTMGLQGIADWLANNVDAAEDFGRSVQAVIGEVGERVEELRGYLVELGLLTEQSFNANNTTGFIDGIQNVISFIATLNGAIEAVADTAREAFFQMADAVSGGMGAAINAVLSAVESMVNGVLAGVRAVAGQIDSMTGAAASLNGKIPEWLRPEGLRTEGTNLAGKIGTFTAPRVDIGTNLASGASLGQTAKDSFEAGKEAVDSYVDGEVSQIRARKDALDMADDALAIDRNIQDGNKPVGTGNNPEGTAPAVKSAGGGGKGSSGSTRTERPFFENIEQDIANLERQAQTIGKTTEQVATMEARWKLLDEAKKRGIPVNDTLNAQIEAQATKFGQLTAELERQEIAQQQFEQAVDGIAGAMSNALIAGESLREGLAQVFAQIAQDILSSGIKNALQGQFNAGGGFLGGLGGLFKGFIPGFASGGIHRGGLRVVGENGPEIEATGPSKILTAAQVSRALVNTSPSQSQSGGEVGVRVYVDESGNWQAKVEQISGNVSAKVVEASSRRQSDSQYLRGA